MASVTIGQRTRGAERGRKKIKALSGDSAEEAIDMETKKTYVDCSFFLFSTHTGLIQISMSVSNS